MRTLHLTLLAVLTSPGGTATALDLIERDRYWERNPEAWADDHAYEAREHGYFADEHRWIRQEDRRAWYTELEAVLAGARADYEQAIAGIGADDDAFFQSIERPNRDAPLRSRTLTVYPAYGRNDLAGLSPADEAMLDQLVDALRGRSQISIAVTGHANRLPLSPRAANRYGDNVGLSRARAETVADYLRTALALPAEAISVAAKGAAEPLDPSATARANARNRRVEVVVGYQATVALQAAPDPDYPQGFVPWWQAPVMGQMWDASKPQAADLSGLFLRALEHSTQIRVFTDVPLIRETAILEAEGDFDARLYMEAEYRDTDEPVGSTLRTGGPDRFREEELAVTAGVRKKVASGGEVELSQRIGAQDNNSVFFLPDDQALSRLRLSFTQPLLRGAGVRYNRSTVAIAKIDTSVAEDELQRQIESHLLEIAQSYWSLYQERARFQIGRRLEQRSLELLDELQGRRGLDALEVQIATARAAHAQRAADLVRTGKAIRNAEARLVTLINDPAFNYGIDFEFVPSLPPLPPRTTIDVEEASRHALKNRPEIDQAMKQLRAGMVRTRISENEMLPELDLIAGMELNGLEGDFGVGRSFDSQFSEGDPSYFVGLRLNYALGNREAKARYQRRRIEARQLSNQLRTTINTLLLETQVSVRETHAARYELKARYAALQAAEKELETLTARRGIAQRSGVLGSDYATRVLTAQEDLADAELAFSASRVNYSLAVVNLDRAMGVLLQTNSIETVRTQTDGALPAIELRGP